jgi:FkbM family methyltransferase
MPLVEIDGLRFVVQTPIEHWRATTLLTKEPGTIAWLQEACKPGTVVLDVGANVGAYTLYAARLVGPTGHVIAVEPHVGTAHTLLQNVRKNGFEDRVTVLTVALGARAGWQKFHYSSLIAGSSGHQLGHRRNEAGQEFTPASIEVKCTTTVDRLVIEGVMPSPSVVKIDVDGNEPDILFGMRTVLLTVQALQVEVHMATAQAIDAIAQALGFQPGWRHDTSQGAKAVLEGADPQNVAHNLVYTR